MVKAVIIKMHDSYGRSIDYLRISVTDRCNLRCIYCMPETKQTFLPEKELLTIEEWVRFCKGAAMAGIRKIRITGGEPLMRKDILLLVNELTQIQGIQQVVMTSNGIHLASMARKLHNAGLSGVNVSIDSLNRESYYQLTGQDRLQEVLDGLHTCGEIGLPLKVNCVPVSGKNEDTLWELIDLARTHAIEIRFIEMMPIGAGTGFDPIPNTDILRQLEHSFGTWTQIQRNDLDGPAVTYTNPAFFGKIGFISPVSQRFCPACNRIRMTADGKLKLCLHHPAQADMRAILRQQGTPEEINDFLYQIIQKKPKNGHQTEETRPMWRIGG